MGPRPLQHPTANVGTDQGDFLSPPASCQGRRHLICLLTESDGCGPLNMRYVPDTLCTPYN